MLILFPSVLILFGLLFWGWRLTVGRSRLEVTSNQVHFPTVSGYNLDRQEIEFPRDFGGELNLLFVPFQQEQQRVVNTWIPFAQDLEAALPQLIYYELPTIEELPAIARTFVNEGMRAGIPDPKARQRTITLYIDLEKFMRATGIQGRNDVHILLVNRKGEILWRTTGVYDQTKGSELLSAIQAILPDFEQK
jgi:hypothetical protein